ncbi:MAG TPA: CPBP family glutamic-type intramembrane protease [Beijerinckiaceae bacterium]
MSTDAAGPRPAFWPAFLRIAALGLLALLSLLPLLAPALAALRTRPGLDTVPAAVLAAGILAQPALLVLAASGIGAALAPRVGLRSLVAGPWTRERARGGWRTALLLAVAIGFTILLADLGLRRLSPGSFAGLGAHLGEGTVWVKLNALLYGGIVEEILLRFGLMTLLVWVGARLAPATFGRRPGWVLWPANALAALAFAAGHLPGLAAAVPLDGVLVFRTLALNGAAGLAYGWLYARYGLERAMVAHAATHGMFWLAGSPLARLAAP